VHTGVILGIDPGSIEKIGTRHSGLDPESIENAAIHFSMAHIVMDSGSEAGMTLGGLNDGRQD